MNLAVRENLEGQYVSNLTAHEVYRGARCAALGMLCRVHDALTEAAALVGRKGAPMPLLGPHCGQE